MKSTLRSSGRFDGGAPSRLAANGLGGAPDLAPDPDLEAVGIVVTATALVDVDAVDRRASKFFEIGDNGAAPVAIIGVAVQHLGMQHELPALGGSDRCCDRDLATELVGSPRPAAADAFDLGSPLTIGETIPVNFHSGDSTDSVRNSLTLLGNYNVQSFAGSASLISELRAHGKQNRNDVVTHDTKLRAPGVAKCLRAPCDSRRVLAGGYSRFPCPDVILAVP